MIAIVALSLPMTHAAVAAECSIRSRDFLMAPVSQGNGAIAPAIAESTRVVLSRTFVGDVAHGGNGDTVFAREVRSNLVRRASEFGFGQGGPEITAVESASRIDASDAGATQSN